MSTGVFVPGRATAPSVHLTRVSLPPGAGKPAKTINDYLAANRQSQPTQHDRYMKYLSNRLALTKWRLTSINFKFKGLSHVTVKADVWLTQTPSDLSMTTIKDYIKTSILLDYEREIGGRCVTVVVTGNFTSDAA